MKSTIRVHLNDFPKYNDKLELKGRNLYTDSQIIAITLDTNVHNVIFRICGALVSGAITDPNSIKALNHAELYYEEIRKMHGDVDKIAANTGYSKEVIGKIKFYLFEGHHSLTGIIKRFDPSFEIAQSWQRLMSTNRKDIKPHDLTLIRHEIEEMKLVQKGIDQNTAHLEVSKTLNYKKEAEEYYDALNKHKKKR